MKRFVELRPEDLATTAVWRYDGENDEVAFVHPTDRNNLSEIESGVYLARTEFVLSNGARHVGVCSPTDDSGLDYLQPAIVTAHGVVRFWFEDRPTTETLENQWKRLGVDAAGIFPVSFRCTVPIEGRFIAGLIEAKDITTAA